MANRIDFDLSVIPPSERFQFWYDVGSRIYRPVPQGGGSGDELYVRSRVFSFGSVIVARMLGSSQHYERTESMVKADQVDCFHLIAVEKGSIEWHGKRELFQAGAGDLLLLDAAQIGQFRWSEHKVFFASVPRELLAPVSARFGEPAQGVLGASHPYAGILSQHLHALCATQMANAEDASWGLGLGLGLVELIRIYFQQASSRLLVHSPLEGNDLLLASMKEWIGTQLHRVDLDARMIGRHFHLSRSSVYALFSASGGVRAYIQSLRLQMALDALQSPRRAEIAIGRLAISLGFSSVSAFSRAFRERWGETPTEVKARAVEAVAQGLDEAQVQDPLLLMQPERSRMSKELDRYYATLRRD